MHRCVMPGLAFPAVGPSGHRSPPCRHAAAHHRYYARLRLPSRRLRVLRCSLVPRYLGPHHFFVFPHGLATGRDTSSRDAWRCFLTDSPGPVRWRGSCWISPVPGLPLCPHAPAIDPGGVAPTRPLARATAAFRVLHPVGFPRSRGYLNDHHNESFRGSTLAACELTTPCFRHPLARIALRFVSRLLAKLWRSGT